jgi:hypothetical protein
MKKLIKITSCSDKMFWYSRHVGNYAPFPYIREDNNCYWTREDSGYLNFILKADGIVEDVVEAS